MWPYGVLDDLVKGHVADLRREAEQDRLVSLAIGPGRPIRSHIARWLIAAAVRIEGSPRASTAPAEA